MKILAVDDDASILELIPMMLARLGFADVTTELSAPLALEILEKADGAFDCLLFDIQMPGMDGIELCRHVRTLPAYSTTPIIMLTAMTEKDYIDRAFKEGATDYATKPFDITELGARLRMAQEFVRLHQVAVASGHADGDSVSPGQPRHVSRLTDEIRIEGIKNLIGYTALANYLAQLSRTGLAVSQVSAVKIDRFEAIHDRASPEEFLYALTDVAAAIRDAIDQSSLMMAYTGNGIFMIVSGMSGHDASSELEAEIQNLIYERNPEYDNGDPVDIEVSIGNPIRPNTGEQEGVRNTFARAIARAETRAAEKPGEPGPLSIARARRK